MVDHSTARLFSDCNFTLGVNRSIRVRFYGFRFLTQNQLQRRFSDFRVVSYLFSRPEITRNDTTCRGAVRTHFVRRPFHVLE